LFFSSSRRRHTRSKRDWSSDVCSSDLARRSEREPLSLADRVNLMHANNPLYVVRNHLAQRCIVAAQEGDYGVLDEFFAVLTNPFTEQSGMAHWASPPGPDEQVSMLSCSS